VRRVDASVQFVTFIDAMLSLVVTQDVLLEAEGRNMPHNPPGCSASDSER